MSDEETDRVLEDDGEAPEEAEIENGENGENEEAAVEENEEADGEENGDGGEGKEIEDEENGDDGDADEADGDDSGAPGSAYPLSAVVEALLFAAREPLKPAQIARAAGGRTRQSAVREAVADLNVHYLETGRAFEIAEISGRFQLMSRPEYAAHIMRIYPKRDVQEKDKTQHLTPSLMDTLAIIAYKQPVMRSEIDHIRGVPSANALRTLIARGSVKEVGRRSDLVGKPAVYGTTERFLAEFGLGSLDELPMRNDFVDPQGPPPVEVALSPEGEDAGQAPAEEATPEETAPEETPAEEAIEAIVEETTSEEAIPEEAAAEESNIEQLDN